MERETAMKILKELHDNSLFSNRIALETIIPQLADGNDERIRKDIIAYIRKANGEPNNILPSGSYCVLEMITWLEKQGKQKLFDYEHATITQKDDERIRKELIKVFSNREKYLIDQSFGDITVSEALALANMLIDLSKDRYGRWEIGLFVSTAISDIIEQIQEIRKELEEL